MNKDYNQFRAMLAVTKASLIATFRSPQAIFFSLFFPLVLIWIFGSLSGGGSASVDVAFEKTADTTNAVYQQLRQNPFLHVVDPAKKDIEDELRKGRLAAVIDVQKNGDTTARSPYIINLRTSSAAQKDFALLQSVLSNVIHRIDEAAYPDKKSVAVVTQSEIPGRKYRMIDFFLPGMIGFSLIGAAVFGVAFSFNTFRETLVLKRMYSTPIRRQYILLGEGISRMLFQLLTVIILIAFGFYAYQFTLANGWLTFADMLILSALGLLVFMGFGFFISGVAKNQNVIPIYANLFMFPQYFLSGTFFSKSSLPDGLQPFIKFLPLTALNDAMRNVAFEGTSLVSCWPEILIMAGWGILIYAVTTKVFRWE